MKSRYIAVILCFVLLLSGCSTQEASRIYTVCKTTEKYVYVYNMTDGFFLVSNGSLRPIAGDGLQKKPQLVLRFDGSTDFVLEREMPSVYSGTKDDALHYVAHLCLTDDAKYTLTSVDWKSFEMLVTSTEYDIRVRYTNDDRVRIYALDSEGEAIVPPYLEDVQ